MAQSCASDGQTMQRNYLLLPPPQVIHFLLELINVPHQYINFMLNNKGLSKFTGG